MRSKVSRESIIIVGQNKTFSATIHQIQTPEFEYKPLQKNDCSGTTKSKIFIKKWYKICNCLPGQIYYDQGVAYSTAKIIISFLMNI